MDSKMRSSSTQTTKPPPRQLLVKDFNEVLTCKLCNGYMIEPMTVDLCMHSYCRSCIGKHLLTESYCPQCKQQNVFKHITENNVNLDEALRAVVYKLVPGLYHKEQERKLHYLTKRQIKQEKKCDYKELVEAIEQDERQQNVIFFAPAEPISLSLEYHPAMLSNCSLDSEIPPVRYLQCPAGVKIQHLKRFLCSKYDIDPENKLVQIDIMYEDELLPNDLTLMDVGYCYNWRRQAPMSFQYRILVYDELPPPSLPLKDINLRKQPSKRQNSQSKSVSFADEQQEQQPLPPPETSILQTILKLKPGGKDSYYSKYAPRQEHVKEKHKKKSHKVSADVEQPVPPMKVIIARKPLDPTKKHSSKRAHGDGQTFTVTSDFKSLRSNDLRYCNDYSVTSLTTTTTGTTSTTKTVLTKIKTSPPATPKCDILVSIPQSQLPKLPFEDEPVLKTASSKKLPTLSIVNNNNNSNLNNNNTTISNNNNNNSIDEKKKNVPKLKIELNSLKTKITIPKPKSADVRHGHDGHEYSASKAFKQRKRSFDESVCYTSDTVDLATYAKNIGLRPIEPQQDGVERLKNSPSASPMSSSSSSTSSSSSQFPLVLGSEAMDIGGSSSTSTHKKRKKKHSKDPNGKRRKLHAEISSQLQEESLKMKVKITAAHPHKHKRSSHSNSESGSKSPSIERECEVLNKIKLSEIPAIEAPVFTAPQQECSLALTRTLSEESKSINKLMDESNSKSLEVTVEKSTMTDPKVNDLHKEKLQKLFPKPQKLEKPQKPEKLSKKVEKHEKVAAAAAVAEKAKASNSSSNLDKSSKNTNYAVPVPRKTLPHLLPKPSPPLPPSLFKSPAFQSLLVATMPQLQPISSADKLKAQKLYAQFAASAGKPVTPPAQPQQFAVPQTPAPQRQQKYLGHPSSIASAHNKQLQTMQQQKRAASLEEGYGQALSKQQKLTQDMLQRKSAYGPTLEPGFYAPVAATSPPALASTASSNPQNQKTFLSCFAASLPNSNAIPNSQLPKTGTQSLLSMRLTEPLHKPAAQSSVLEMPPLHPPLSPPAGSHRLMGPPLTLLKSNRKPAALNMSPPLLAGTGVKSPPLPLFKAATAAAARYQQQYQQQQQQHMNAAAYRSSPPALINLRNNALPVKPAASQPAAEPLKKASETNGATALEHDKPKTSLREFRPIQKESNQSNSNNTTDILDLSSTNRNQHVADSGNTAAASTKELSIATPIGSSLEAALNKIKQNMTTGCVPQTTTDTANGNGNKAASPTASSDDHLQNLHLLSESATAREKLAITAPLFQKPKPPTTTIVRQQNASVRSIPNPSALAFRNQPPPLMVASTGATTAATTTASLTVSAVSTPTTVTSVASVTSPTSSSANPPTLSLLTISKPLQLLTTSLNSPKTEEKMQLLPLPLPTTPKSPPVSTPALVSPTATTVSPPRAMKKLTSIDQVAANLNIRAAAAEASACAKAAKEEEQRQSATATNKDITADAEPAKLKEAPMSPTTNSSAVSSPKPAVENGTNSDEKPAAKEEKSVEAEKPPKAGEACDESKTASKEPAKSVEEPKSEVKTEDTTKVETKETVAVAATLETNVPERPKSPLNCAIRPKSAEVVVTAPSITNSA